MYRATPTLSQSKIKRETELNGKTAERWVQHLKEVLKQPKPNGEPAAMDPLDDLNITALFTNIRTLKFKSRLHNWVFRCRQS